MKYLNLAVITAFMLIMVSCGGNAKKSSHIEESESVEEGNGEKNNIDDEDDILEEDENAYLTTAMEALDAGNTTLAVENIMKAVTDIKGYIGEMDDPAQANTAITTLLDIATKIKSGVKMSSEDLEKALSELAFFSEDDLEINDSEIEESN